MNYGMWRLKYDAVECGEYGMMFFNVESKV